MQALASPVASLVARRPYPRFARFAWRANQHTACRTKTRTRTSSENKNRNKNRNENGELRTQTRTLNPNENPELRTLNPEPGRGTRYTATDEIRARVRHLRLE